MILTKDNKKFEILKFKKVTKNINKYVGSLDGMILRGFTRKKTEIELLSELSNQNMDLSGFQIEE